MADRGVRFAVQTDDGRQSTVWRFWPSTTDESVMLSPRLLAKHGHISIHQSGHCHYKLSSEHSIETAIQAGKEPIEGSVRLAEWRVLSDWVGGWQRPLSITVPVAELRAVARETPKPISWIRPGAGTQVVSIAVLIGSADTRQKTVPASAMRPHAIAVARFRTRSVWLVAYRDRFVPEWVLEEIDTAKQDAEPAPDAAGGQLGLFRMARQGPDGCRFIIDLGPPESAT
jgi:hypothetical protein